ncbi:Cullin [Cokeromyces recurvatus]|uniref:Cullin n=1 Tax=Cokeromyces recurvatus TaxID=90255 RepID=UPI00221F6F15|nr:Cullin [Cokeromyces recurvatus]KAI7901142.1 Cullin [Cokeromyces recurvatus]
MTLRRKAIDFNEHFSQLIEMLNGIFAFNSKQQQIKGMTMYQVVYDMCIAIPRPFTEKVFIGIAEYLDQHTLNECKRILKHDDIVTTYARAFKQFALAAEYMSRGCCYLDRIITSPAYSTNGRSQSGHQNYLSSGKYKRQHVEALALQLWKSNVLFIIRDRYQNKLFYQVFELIRQDRDGEDDAPHSIIKTVVTSLVQVNSFTEQPLQLYIEEFERPYLVHTKRYYEAEAAHEIASGNMSRFMKNAYQRLEQEITRNNQYCHSTSHSRIVREFEAQYIAAYQDRIIDEFGNMLENEQFSDCTLAYKLLNRIPSGLKPILAIYEDYVAKLGTEILSALGSSVTKNPKAYVDQLIALHTKYYQVNHQVFLSEPSFTAAVDKAFRRIINESNHNDNKTNLNGSNCNAFLLNSPEILARYCDMMLKKSAGRKEMQSSNATNGNNIKRKGLIKKPIIDIDESDQEEKLIKMITLFNYVDDKDVFQKFYSRMLAKRLIYNSSLSEELEINMINRLKEICGVEYTSKLNKMFTDISLSSELNAKYKTFIKEKNRTSQTNMEMLVLTAGAWPLNQQKEDSDLNTNKLQIPRMLEVSISSFEQFYKNQHNGRRLLWQWNLTRGEVRINHLDKNYEIQVSLYQMIILLLFNQSNITNINEITIQSGLTLSDVMKSIKPLIDMRVLETVDELPLTSSSDIKVNQSFTSKRTKIKVAASSAQNEIQQQENVEARKSIDEDRRMYIQAAIVRIMKSRQTLPHVQLVQEIFDQANSRFSPSVIMIKKCIEQLLEKQFIARKERDTYVYVA